MKLVRLIKMCLNKTSGDST